MILSVRRVELFQRAVQGSEERSDFQPEVPIGFRKIDLQRQLQVDRQVEFLQTDFHVATSLAGGADSISRP